MNIHIEMIQVKQELERLAQALREITERLERLEKPPLSTSQVRKAG